jgi:hypothetical protein
MSFADMTEIDPVALKELELIDADLSDIDTEVMARKVLQLAPVLEKRQHTIAKIPGFWATVFDNAAVELEAAITPLDTEIFAKALIGLEVLRPEIPAGVTHLDSGLNKFGEPRSVTINFHFKENEWFSDSVLSKTLYFRATHDGSNGLSSDPIKINWKAGKDVTEGLTDAAYALWAAQKQNPSQGIDADLTKEARKARDAQAKQLPEYKALVALLEQKVQGAISFFNFFSYRGRWTSAAESKAAIAKVAARRAAAHAGQAEDEDDDEEDEDEMAEEDAETFPPGHEVAVSIAEDIWPDAIDYFFADTIDSELGDEDSDEDEDVEME